MKVKQLARENKEYGISIRRMIHQRPELGGQEFETAKLIEDELDSMGIQHRRVAATNVVGIIPGGKSGHVIGLRADMDALPIVEACDVDYRSQKNGVMHACGHDGHTAALLSAAKILSNMRDELCGTVKLLFQSAEEAGTGALELIESGEIDDLDALLGIHIWNDVEHGMLYIGSGEEMASPIEFRITLKGRGGHGSQPHKTIDATVPLASLVMNLQSLVGREFDPMSNVVLTVGRILSGPNEFVQPGTRYNIIAGDSYMEGNIRVFNDKDADYFEKRLRQMLEATEKMYGVDGALVYHPHCPSVINDTVLANLAKETCVALWGEDSLDHTLGKVMAGEDFGHYRKKVPSLFVFVGSKNLEKLSCYPHHNPNFNIDEDAIEQASCFYAQFALDYLKKGE